MHRHKKEISGIDCVHAVSGIAGNPGIRYRSLSILPPQLLWASNSVISSQSRNPFMQRTGSTTLNMTLRQTISWIRSAVTKI
jgi:hypothetical protein